MSRREHDWFDDFMISNMMEEDTKKKSSSSGGGLGADGWLTILALLIILEVILSIFE